jgi:predicted pyridoxine 5'-phosphate oxidase superfamily flavin-nucleotide-binding protein
VFVNDSAPGAKTVESVSGERMLQEQWGTRERADQFYGRQVLDHLNDRMRAFIGVQEWMFVATSSAAGACDSTLRAGPAGFVAVLDEHRLAWPEYRGNGVLASRGNIIENPHVGLLFVDFVRDRIGLHVNGRARLVDDAEVRSTHPGLPVDTVPGRRPEQWVVAEVVEAYIHCAKHIPRLHRHPADRHHLGHHPATKKSDYFVPAEIVPADVTAPPDVVVTSAPMPPVAARHPVPIWRRGLRRIAGLRAR